MAKESHLPDVNLNSGGVVVGDVEGGIHGSNVAGRDIVQEFTAIFRLDPSAQRDQRNRQIMLQRVKAFWVKGVLEGSVHNAMLIELGMQEQSAAVDHPWDVTLEISDDPCRALLPGKPIVDIFDEMGCALLILGAPGSGKTITLLELARDAIARAEKDSGRPIPAVFNLSSWPGPRQSLADWLLDELNIKYQIPRKAGRRWVADNDLFLLLDGLDEVKPDRRQACIEAINQFRQEHGLASIVVCSRTEEYAALTTRLKFAGAILIQPLTITQIDNYLAAAGPELAALRAALSADVTLRELAQTPLMLSIMALVYHGLPVAPSPISGAFEGRCQDLFAAYVERMLKRRAANKYYTPQQTTHWLAWLARTMSQNGQTEFFIEGMQPTWLPTRAQRLLYAAGVGLAGGLLFVLAGGLSCALGGILAGGTSDQVVSVLSIGSALGLVGGLAFELASGLAVKLPSWLAVGLAAGLAIVPAIMLLGPAGGLFASLAFGLPGGLAGVSISDRNTIRIAEMLKWSWKKAKRGLVAGLVTGLAVGWVIWLLTGDLADVLAGGGPIGLAFVLALGLTRSEAIEIRTVPNQGIRRSARNALWIGAAVLLASVLLGVLIGAIRYDPMDGLTLGLVIGLLVGSAAGLALGGAVCIQHLVLCLLLRCSQGIPWDLVRFLDYAAEHIFLRKVGGGYIFVHRLLLDYFVTLEKG